jgi:5-methylcytosine-specific restriction endonuclease McrA
MAQDKRTRVAELVKEGLTGREIARVLGISPATVAYHRRRLHLPMNPKCARRHDWAAIQAYYDEGYSVRECREKFGFSGKTWYDAVKRGAVVPRPQAVPIEQLFVNGRRRGRNHLKVRLFAAGLKENKCEDCGLFIWQGKPLSLALHHINGDGHDNRLENLALLCPNCHSQTPNFGVKNIARARKAA